MKLTVWKKMTFPILKLLQGKFKGNGMIRGAKAVLDKQAVQTVNLGYSPRLMCVWENIWLNINERQTMAIREMETRETPNHHARSLE